jgi:uncharacterized membrane protein YhiD involved in acid resistance
MTDGLGGVVSAKAEVDPGTMAYQMGLSLAGGVVVAAIYRLTRRPGPEGVSLTGTLVLLSVLITLVMVAIGDNLARAFGLVGALSIVRFRTVVDDSRDTAFVIFSVAVGMVIGAGYEKAAAVGVPIVGASAGLLALWERWATPPVISEAVVQLRLGLGHEPDKVMAEVVGRHLESARLTAASTARQGAAMDLTYVVRWRGEPAVVALVNALNKCDGVQNVEVKLR